MRYMSSEEMKILMEFAQQNSNLSVSITLSDLVEAFRIVVREEQIKYEQKTINENQEKLLTEDEVIRELNTSHSTLWRWHREGYLVHRKIGRKNRYRQSDVINIKNNN